MRITYTGEVECSTRNPDLDWQPYETKNVDPAFAQNLLTNALFKPADAEPHPEGGAD